MAVQILNELELNMRAGNYLVVRGKNPQRDVKLMAEEELPVDCNRSTLAAVLFT
jgi:hypothetical protein